MRRKVILTTLILLSYYTLRAEKSIKSDIDIIAKAFQNPPESVQTATYWYWMNNHISEEGVVKDLQAMKRAGINRVFIGTDIRNRTNFSRDTTGQYFGKVKVFSDGWWKVLHTALKTASDLNIEVGIFNCPGWSQSGGPWVKPEQAMRYLEASEVRVKGPLRFSQTLAKPHAFFQDVKVLAIPVAEDYELNYLDLPTTKITSEKLQTNAPSAKFVLAENDGTLDIELAETATIRSLRFYPGEWMNMKVELQVKDREEYKTVSSFTVNRSQTIENLAKDFEPYAPFSLSLNELQGKFFRLKFQKIGKADCQIANIVMSSTPVIKNLQEKKMATITAGMPSWGAYMWNTQPQPSSDVKFPPSREILDISSHMTSEGMLNWDVPAGNWIIMRSGMRFIDVKNGPSSFEAEGLEVDKMNKTHIESHFNAFIGQILERIPASDRKTFKVVVLDSYERGGQNFTDGFLADFKARYGYDATNFLPVLKGHIVDNVDVSDRFLWDLRRLIADKISYDYVGGLTQVSHKNGLTTWLENYGHTGFAGEFLQYGGQADEVSGEFWYRPVNDKYYENRGAASAAHIYGKNKVWAESFTSGSWDSNFAFSVYPQKLKRAGDWAFTEGINSTLLHVYIQQPYKNDFPGIDAWFGTEFNRKNTWFDQLDLFTTYHKRCNFMLQQGNNVADVAYFIGEDIPKMTGIRQPELPKGYNYDFINAEVILRDLTVKDGRLVLPCGTSYRMLVLPPQKTMRPELLSKIEQLIAAGAVVYGSAPSKTPGLQDYPQAEQRLQELALKMWGKEPAKKITYGKGLLLNKMPLQEVFKMLNLPADCQTDVDSVRFTHRTLDGKEIYFLANIGNRPVDFVAKFRVDGLQPEWWDALNGTMRPLPDFEDNNGVTKVPLRLGVDGSAFIVFATKAKARTADAKQNFPALEVLSTAKSPWLVTFESDSIKRGPANPVIFNQLTDWTKNEDDRIRYYSGKAIYKTTISVNQLPKNHKIYLDLGNLTAMAKVKINGVYAGGVWVSPFQVEATGKIRKGNNEIEIELVSTWLNRLIGDLRLPEKDRMVQSKNNMLQPTSRLQPSGLFGPVTLLSEQ